MNAVKANLLAAPKARGAGQGVLGKLSGVIAVQDHHEGYHPELEVLNTEKAIFEDGRRKAALAADIYDGPGPVMAAQRDTAHPVTDVHFQEDENQEEDEDQKDQKEEE